jgi:site-specific DNA recombinase
MCNTKKEGGYYSMNKIIGYCRVSTDNQKEEGTIDLQRQAIREYAESKGYELVNVFEDEGVSGGIENRPGLAALFGYLELNKDIHSVIIYKLDRLARDLYIQEHLVKKMEALNAGLISTKEPDLASGDPMRKAFRQFMGIVSELEKAFITMRLSGGRLNKAKKGGYAGGKPALGYRAVEGMLVIDSQEAETVKLIRKLRKQGLSLDGIALRLNSLNIPTKRGGNAWYKSTVAGILKNRIYKGILSYAGESCKGQHLPI